MIKDKYILKRLAELEIVPTRDIAPGANVEGERIVTINGGYKKEVLIENVTDDEIKIGLEIEKINILQTLRNIHKFFLIIFILGILGIVVWLISCFS